MRARLLILASTISAVGWGTVLPYQYAYATETRGWSAMTAAVAASLFSIGALIAAHDSAEHGRHRSVAGRCRIA